MTREIYLYSRGKNPPNKRPETVAILEIKAFVALLCLA